jgi:hypothetical protein
VAAVVRVLAVGETPLFSRDAECPIFYSKFAKKTLTMNDNIVVMGVNAPRIHQSIITKLLYGLTNLYLNAQTRLFPYPETMIDESQTSPAPDIMLVDSNTDLTKAIIEITHTQGVKKDAQKLWGLMSDYDVPEGFVYDYKLGIWYKYRLQGGGQAEHSSFCEAVNADLGDFLF